MSGAGDGVVKGEGSPRNLCRKQAEGRGLGAGGVEHGWGGRKAVTQRVFHKSLS